MDLPAECGTRTRFQISSRSMTKSKEITKTFFSFNKNLSLPNLPRNQTPQLFYSILRSSPTVAQYRRPQISLGMARQSSRHNVHCTEPPSHSHSISQLLLPSHSTAPIKKNADIRSTINAPSDLGPRLLSPGSGRLALRFWLPGVTSLSAASKPKPQLPPGTLTVLPANETTVGFEGGWVEFVAYGGCRREPSLLGER